MSNAFNRLCEIMTELRSEKGCPWDREQTLQSLKPYLIEETYEVIEALDQNDAKAHCEELGDLLLQVIFQAELAREQNLFSIDDVVQHIIDKLVRRHPHVFGDAKAVDAKSALGNWEKIKAQERPKDKSVLSGIPKALPALLRAHRTGEKAAAIGFDWPNLDGPLGKLTEEWAELHAELHQDRRDRDRLTDELGDVLFSVVNIARHLKIDAEAALHLACEKFQRRFLYIEQQLMQQNKNLQNTKLDELEELWEKAKLTQLSN